MLKTRQELEAEKLEIEIKLAKKDLSKSGVFSKYFWPMISSLMTLVITVFALYFGLTKDHATELEKENTFFNDQLTLASNPNIPIPRRIGSLWILPQFWDERYNGRYDYVLANSLAALLANDPDESIRLTAAEVIGEAIKPDDLKDPNLSERAKTVSRILYGEGKTDTDQDGYPWEPGVIMRHHWLLKKLESSALASGGSDTAEQVTLIGKQLEATREAIRNNWEYLENAYFKGMDLTGIQLWGANLRNSYFENDDLSNARMDQSDLENATLTNVNLDGCDFTGANLAEAEINTDFFAVKSLKNCNVYQIKGRAQKELTSFLTFARDQGAVEMPSNNWRKWKKSGYKQPHNMHKWRDANFQLTRDGKPVQ